jgi:glutathione S-transferase
MKLYDCTTAPSPRRVRIFAAEKGIELDRVQIDLSTGEQFGDAYRAINPDCVVPTLELDDGTIISEVVAICHYLEEIHPEPALFGQTPQQRASALAWNAKIEHQGLAHIRDAFRNYAKGLKGHALTGPIGFEQIPGLVERGRTGASAFFERLDEQLAKSDFVAGDNFSIADITALVFVDFAAWVKLNIPDELVDLNRWHAAVSTRPSARA